MIKPILKRMLGIKSPSAYFAQSDIESDRIVRSWTAKERPPANIKLPFAKN
ncbi:hypothetical protein [Metasolibacillus sp.]|uniref:hypothetical protein n=1 Tax=Metasolibacillus sp. TaxID=2703680 RepID=UPI0025F793A1|nr:hypothetical protein [Metasolibacillus sp.]MCT6925389.1 hypothetical protein [Metasolibacillus sp.]MCT6941583.1 hypothetical protein [Metasolibacillus sp.]